MASAVAGDIIQLDEVREGDQICSTNYRFLQIGQPIPIGTSSNGDTIYDSQNPPYLPLAVSERFRLLFVAHSNGFYVARTEEVMAAAEDWKDKGSGPSIHELSIINISIGSVSILALSSQNSMLAASVENQIHVFMMSALLNKDDEPSFSVGLDDSGNIRDMKWAGKDEKDYVVLSSTGKLYHGSGRGSIKDVLVDVGAVEWSASGEFLAVARRNILSIMTSEFKEKLSFSLSPSSVMVDTIRWVHQDRIVVGSFALDDDSEDATYLVQVITAEGKDITDTSSKPAVVSFPYMFLDYRFDVVPGAAGPNMFLYYLENHELAFVANRRNLSQHVVLLGWFPEDQNSGAAMIEASNDAWAAHIESQGNGDDNLVLALSVDKVSQNKGIKFILGEKDAEVSPCCIVLCVTVDGKLSLFHFASAAGTVSSRQDLSDADGQDDKHLNVISEKKLSGISTEVVKPNVQHVSHTSEYDKLSRNETYNNDKPEEHSGSCNQVQKSSVSSQTLKRDDKDTFSFTNLEGNRSIQGSEFAAKPSLKSEYSLLNNSQTKVQVSEARNVSKTITRAHLEAKPSADSFSERVFNDPFRQSVSKSMQTSDGSGFPVPNTQTDLRIPVSSSSIGRHSENKSASLASSVSSFGLSSLGPKAVTMVENSGTPPSFGSQNLMKEKFVSGKSSILRLNEENIRTNSHLQESYHEQKPSSQFSNVEVLVKKMDQLLEHIDGDGGFKDASITSQEGSVSVLEESLWKLSDRCRKWRGKLEEQSRDIQHLLDKTVQVLARKVYMEGIFLQATDNWYSDLWNSQKLSLELELKRQHILEVDQELASQLVQLERHFNTIEFNKFGENGALQDNQKVMQSVYGKPRRQCLRTLQNTMSAQLAAAEKLSECLGKQMAALNIECVDSKQNIKREVFEALGLAYDGASYHTLSKEKAPDTPRKDLLVKFSSVTAKDQHRKSLSTPVKNSEPQTVRRHRDTLDQMRSSVVPSKTTVKRILLQEDHGSLESRFPIEVKPHLELELGEESVQPVHVGPEDGSARSFHYISQTSSRTAMKKSAVDSSSSLSHWTGGLADIEGIPARSFAASVERSPSTASVRQNGARENHTFSGNYTSNPLFSQTSGSESCVQQSPKFPSDGLSVAERISAVSVEPFTNSVEDPIFRNEELGPCTNTTREVKSTTTKNGSSLSSFNVSSDKTSVPSGPASIFPRANRPDGKLSSATNQIWLSPASTSLLEPSVKSKSDVTQKSLQSHSFSSFSTSSLTTLVNNSFSSGTPTSIEKSSESQESGSHPCLPVVSSNKDEIVMAKTTNTTSMEGEIGKAEEATVMQAELPNGSSCLIIGSEASSTAPVTKLTSLNSESELDIGSSSNPPVSEMAPSSMLGQAWLAKDDSPASTTAIFPGSSLGGKDYSSSVNNEDEMEEEAPESYHAADLSFGDLGGLGFGATSPSTSNVTKPNPFGVDAVTQMSSPFQMSSPSGELFRPASFNFPSALPSQPSVASTTSLFTSGFGTGSSSFGPSSGGFGQPAQLGSGQQALGSVLGAFGQSRQLGASPPGNGIAPSSGFSNSFTAPSVGFGFAGAARPGGGFAAAATFGGGFAAAASSGGGFASVARPGGGGGFAAAATAGSGLFSGAFGASGNQVGGNFSAFGSSSGAGRPPSDLFTQMRK